MFIAMNQFQVAPGKGPEFEAMWRTRESHLENVPGFIRFSLLRGDEGVYISHSTWENEKAFVAWTESEAFVKAHRQGTPQGVLAGPPRFSGYQVILDQQGRAQTA